MSGRSWHPEIAVELLIKIEDLFPQVQRIASQVWLNMLTMSLPMEDQIVWCR